MELKRERGTKGASRYVRRMYQDMLGSLRIGAMRDEILSWSWDVPLQCVAARQ